MQEDAECPLCLEEMDISDLNFKPCPCGYQVGVSLAVLAASAHLSQDMPFLLASYQGKPEWAVPGLQEGVYR